MGKVVGLPHSKMSSPKGDTAKGLTTARSSRSARLRLIALAVPLLAVAVTAVPAASAGARHVAGASTEVMHYAIGVPVCGPPRQRSASCFAMRLVEVKRGTPGARLYEPGAGIARSVARDGVSTIGPAGGLTPSDLAGAYNFGSTATGSGQTVAIVDAYNDPKINSDLQGFDSLYRLLTCSTSNGCLRVVNQNGGSTLPPDDTIGWSVEESLDVETVHSVCQKCKIILVEATSQSFANLAAAVNEAVKLKATEISNSYGFPESVSTSTEEAAFNHPGVVITASSGDDGYYDYDQLGGGSPSPYNQADAPASYNTVVAVGGTSLYLGQTATRQSESVWNDNGTRDVFEIDAQRPLGAEGGGCSTAFPAQGWQTHLKVWPSTACGTHRLVSDIAADADYLTGFDIYTSYNCGAACGAPGWRTLGGTSLASPIIASMFALAGGSHGVAYPALTLYGHLGSSALNDIVNGGNGWCGGEGAAACGDPNKLGGGILDCDYPAFAQQPSAGDRACDAQAGYDGPTGVGTPNGLGAFAKTGPTAKFSGPSSVASGRPNEWTAAARDPFPGGRVTSYTWNWGDGSTSTVTTTGSASHDYVTGSGNHKITLTVGDNYGETGTTTYSVSVTA